MLNRYYELEEQLNEIRDEDIERMKERCESIPNNPYFRDKIDKKKKLNLYHIMKNKGYTGSGIYYKKNEETGDLFLSRYSSGLRKEHQKISNKKVRKNWNINRKGNNYKKLHDLEWNIT